MSKKCCTFAAMLGKRCAIWIMLIACCAGMWSCSSHRLEEAQTTVATADSLWHNGQCLSDSTQLAQAYHTLHRRRAVYPDEYAHACYHYGKLLRAQDDPVAAMQVFIHASHSRTHDYHILGRIYSNMGSICHLAGEFPMAFNMYKRSADIFLHDRDTLSYYYLLNDMAFELAEQSKKEETLNVLSTIEDGCTDEDVIAKTWETKARLYMKCEQYDSALYYAHILLNKDIKNNAVTLIIAQSYSYMGYGDSATFYANKLLSLTNELYEINNALYILTNDDETRDKDAIREVAADRADTQKQIEILQGRLSQAVQLLEQDMSRKPNLVWLYVMITTIIVTGGCFYWRIIVRKHQMEKRVGQLIEHQADTITQSIRNHIDTNDIAHTLHWKNYAAMKADADLYMGGIASKLENMHLNETEIRFCILTMLDFSQSRIAETIHYSYPSGIKTLKKRISVKMGTTPPKLRDFLFQIAMNI